MKRTPEEAIVSILVNLRTANAVTLADARRAFNTEKYNEARTLLGIADGLHQAINLVLTETQGIES